MREPSVIFYIWFFAVSALWAVFIHGVVVRLWAHVAVSIVLLGVSLVLAGEQQQEEAFGWMLVSAMSVFSLMAMGVMIYSRLMM